MPINYAHMIDVPELDTFIKSIFYSLNCNAPIYAGIFSKEAQTAASFMLSQQGTFVRFKDVAEQSGLGFSFSIGRCNSMFGVSEMKGLYDPVLLLAAPFLKIYPRLIYSHNFIQKTVDFGQHNYYFRYYPKMLVRVYVKTEDGKETKLIPSTHWLMGSHNRTVDGKTIISYNVAVNVDINTIVEEELHGQIPNLHDTNSRQDIVKKIETDMPELRNEIESNLNRILSTEEKKFKELGNILRVEFASELRTMDAFIKKFENDVVQSAILNLVPDPTVQTQKNTQNELKKGN
jgi:hypothetical protein